VSGLDELTREGLIALVLELYTTEQAQQKRIAELQAIVQSQVERIAELEEEVGRLRGGKSSAALCIKPSVPRKEKRARKKRKQSFSRCRLPATRVVHHAVECCPDCRRRLSGGSVKWVHQVVDIPLPAVEVTDHVFLERRCGVCGKRWTPDAGSVLGGVVVGKKSVGINLMSVVAHLKTACRVPVGQIRKLLGSLYGVRISAGEITEILHEVARIGEPRYGDLLNRVRGSPVLHGDETGWREAGANGYLWSFSSAEVRYYTRRDTRGSSVVKEVLGDKFAGKLVTDFYGAYNSYDGIKQRCWVHLLRDLKQLVEKNPDMPEVSAWVDSVADVYHRAKESVRRECTERERSIIREDFERELVSICKPYVGVKNAAQRVLAERMMERFIGELFTFVQYPEVPSENNAAERAIRPAVVARKISGGTRSPKGSKTSSVLRSLFETWALHGHNTIDACRQMLTQANRTAESAPV